MSKKDDRIAELERIKSELEHEIEVLQWERANRPFTLPVPYIQPWVQYPTFPDPRPIQHPLGGWYVTADSAGQALWNVRLP